MLQIILCITCGCLLGAAGAVFVFRAVKRKGTYTRLVIDDLIDYFQQVNQEVLLESATGPSSGRQTHGWASYTYRRELRLRLDLLKDYVERMSRNAARPEHVAQSDLLKMREHNLEYPAESITAIRKVIETDREFQRLAGSVLRRIWLWSLIGFEWRTWGPVPDFRTLGIPELVGAYNRVKEATKAYALLYGDVGGLIAQEIQSKM